MPLQIIVTPGATNANSYCTLEEAEAYHATNLYPWSADEENDRKTIALIWATRLLDEQVKWPSYPTNVDQALRWPRFNVMQRDGIGLLDSDTIPQFLKDATAELAKHLLAGDRTEERIIGISRIKADVTEVVFDKGDVPPILPPSVVSIVEAYGEAQGGESAYVSLRRA